MNRSRAAEEQIGLIVKASLADIEDAAIAAEKVFGVWSMFLRSSRIRERAEQISLAFTAEHGRP